MSELIWEELVQAYLTTNRAMLVSRQYLITDGQGWEVCPDLLAVDFRAREAWFVEVTAGSDVDRITRKATEFQTEIVPRLKSQLAALAILADPSGWRFGFWGFVRKQGAAKLREQIAPHLNLVRVEALEDTVFPWVYWDNVVLKKGMCGAPWHLELTYPENGLMAGVSCTVTRMRVARFSDQKSVWGTTEEL